MYKTFFKRILDLVIASAILILSSPVFLLLAFLLLLQNRGNPFFTQRRPGQFQKPFDIIKFKTMNDKTDSDGNLLPNVERVTPLGLWIRYFSLDELPQLINVIKGDMSLIGPRPLLAGYIPLYSSVQNRRHEIRPGITGWAQVNGRNAISWTKKFELDVEYVEKLSFFLDCKIFWLTIIKIIKREGINQSKNRTMMPFDGTN
jgi:lipopolysaccharide/colanic/teichoic acid biosynthesis glycosyltransferase